MCVHLPRLIRRVLVKHQELVQVRSAGLMLRERADGPHAAVHTVPLLWWSFWGCAGCPQPRPLWPDSCVPHALPPELAWGWIGLLKVAACILLHPLWHTPIHQACSKARKEKEELGRQRKALPASIKKEETRPRQEYTA
eukprot:1133519-Pelagomonas_calceolata.AAC.1